MTDERHITWYQYTARRQFRPVVVDFIYIVLVMLAGVAIISALFQLREGRGLSFAVLTPLLAILPFVVLGVALFLIYERLPTSDIGVSEAGLHFGLRPFPTAAVGWDQVAQAHIVEIQGVDPEHPDDEQPTWYAVHMPGLTPLHAVVGVQLALITNAEATPAFVITHHHRAYPHLVARLRQEIGVRRAV